MVTVGYNPSNATALMGPGGLLCIGCCGEEGTVPGTCCGGSTVPTTIQISFTGVSVASTGCVDGPPTVSSDLISIPSPNTIFTLSLINNSSTCTWEYRGTTGYVVENWDAYGCLGSPLTGLTAGIYVRLVGNSTGGTIELGVSTAGNDRASTAYIVTTNICNTSGPYAEVNTPPVGYVVFWAAGGYMVEPYSGGTASIL